METYHLAQCLAYKMIFKTLALKMCHLLLQIVRLEKIGFIKSIYILDNIIVVCEGMEWARHSHQKVLFLKNDLAKIQPW